MKNICFYALRADILGVLEAVERDALLQYVRTGNRLAADFETFHRAADIADLGKADQSTGSVCQAFLVAGRSAEVQIRTLEANGVRRFLVDQLLNPDTVVLRAAGMWQESVILSGSIGTAYDSPISQPLMKRYHSVIRKSFTNVNRVFVGPEALAELRSGRRLTIAVQSPPEFDLVPDQVAGGDAATARA